MSQIRNSMTTTLFLICFLVASTRAFVSRRTMLPKPAGTTKTNKSTQLYGIIDDLKLIFSEEGKKNRREYDERIRAEQEALQQEILDRRRNPELMAQYEENVKNRRQQRNEERAVYDFQNEVKDGVDPLQEWEQKRKEGKIVIGDDLKRDEGTRRLGSEGLQEVRVDERMPYIDQGYVDEDADVFGGLKNIFGGDKKKD